MLTTRGLLQDAATGTGEGNTLGGEGLKNLYFQVEGSNTSVMTILIRGSFSEEKPDFFAAATAANAYENMAIVALETGAVIAGDTGIALTANDVKLFTLNANNPPTHLAAVITSHTTGTVTVRAIATNNTVGN